MIRDATYERELPELNRLHVEYAFEPGDLGIYSSDDRSKPWTVERAAASLAKAGSSPIYLDDESHHLGPWTGKTIEELEELRDHRAEVVRRAREARPDNLISVYGLQPHYGMNDITKNKAEIEAYADRLAYDRLPSGRFAPVGIVDLVHFLVVSGYAFGRGSDTLDGWYDRMAQTIDYTNRWHKPTGILLMPWFHTSHVDPALRMKPIPADLFAGMVSKSLELCGEVYIWNLPARFNKPMPETHKSICLECA